MIIRTDDFKIFNTALSARDVCGLQHVSKEEGILITSMWMADTGGTTLRGISLSLVGGNDIMEDVIFSNATDVIRIDHAFNGAGDGSSWTFEYIDEMLPIKVYLPSRLVNSEVRVKYAGDDNCCSYTSNYMSIVQTGVNIVDIDEALNETWTLETFSIDVLQVPTLSIRGTFGNSEGLVYADFGITEMGSTAPKLINFEGTFTNCKNLTTLGILNVYGVDPTETAYVFAENYNLRCIRGFCSEPYGLHPDIFDETYSLVSPDTDNQDFLVTPGITFLNETCIEDIQPYPDEECTKTITEKFTYVGDTSFTIPAGVTDIDVQIWAGGTSGFASIVSSGNTTASGGGRGGYLIQDFEVDAGDVIYITVGAGGASVVQTGVGSTNGIAGADSYVTLNGTSYHASTTSQAYNGDGYSGNNGFREGFSAVQGLTEIGPKYGGQASEIGSGGDALANRDYSKAGGPSAGGGGVIASGNLINTQRSGAGGRGQVNITYCYN